jgi:formylglycine-generating enzyme required for sulfatase activity
MKKTTWLISEKRLRSEIKIVSTAVLFLLLSFTKENRKPFIPPGTVRITENFFADETEVSNLSWMEYVFWTKTKFGPQSKEHLASMPDTAVWLDKKYYNMPYAQYYLRHKAYKDFPVVGISHAQALAFCKWRTERVKEFCAIKHKTDPDIEYRLPTKDEWEFLSNNGSGIFPTGKNENGQMMLNCHNEDTSSFASYNDVLAPVLSYWKNYFGLVNCFGNVAEMVSENGIAKGGSWRHTLDECRAGRDIQYDKPGSWLGFRCVCIMGSKTEPQ